MKGGEVVANYGAVEEGDKTFDADQMRYLGEKKLSRKEKFEQIFRVGFPILASVIIVAVAFLFLTSFFQKSYPGHVVIDHSGSGSGGSTAEATSSATTATTTSAKTESTKTKHTSMAQCSSHELCADLRGDCCPTDAGLVLECCKS